MQTAAEILNEYLHRIAGFCDTERCHSLERLILNHGRAFEPSIPLPGWIAMGVEKQCYMNATKLVLAGGLAKGFVYVEGFAISQNLFNLGVPIAMQHAWVADKDGNVIDNTWEAGAAYFGIPFTKKYLFKQMDKTGYYGIFPGFGRPTIPPKAIHKFPNLRKPAN